LRDNKQLTENQLATLEKSLKQEKEFSERMANDFAVLKRGQRLQQSIYEA
jgi:hypothetical protein